MSRNGSLGLRGGDGKRVSDAANLRLDDSRDVVLLWQLEHDRMEVREELRNAGHIDDCESEFGW